MEDLNTYLLNYFEKEISEGKTEFRLHATQTDKGVEFYIYPMGKDGITIDLVLSKYTYTNVNLEIK
jgi:hypothetical protein